LLLPACKSTDKKGPVTNGTSGTNSGGTTSGDDRFTASDIQAMWIAPYTEHCVGEYEKDCLLVSFNKNKPVQGEWELFYGDIKDFTYEKGNLYQLKVKIGTLKEEFIMPHGGSKEYILIEVLRKDGA
jgi:hypothetical protein